MPTPQIDPKTGERIPAAGGGIQIDPETGERISAPTTTRVAQPAPEGFFHSLGSSLGVTPEASQSGLDEFKAHPVATSLKNLVGGPALPAIEGVYQGAKRIGGEIA